MAATEHAEGWSLPSVEVPRDVTGVGCLEVVHTQRLVWWVRPSYWPMRCSGALLATALGTAAGQPLSCKYKGADFSTLNKAGVSRLLMSTLRALRALRAQRLGSSQTQATLRAVAPRTDRAPDRGAAGITAHQPVRAGRCVQGGQPPSQLLPPDQLLNLDLR